MSCSGKLITDCFGNNHRRVAWCLSAAILVLAIAGLFERDNAPMPGNPPPSTSMLQNENDFAAAAIATDALKDQVSLLVSISFGLAAVVGFCVTTGPRRTPLMDAAVKLLFCIFVSAIMYALAYAADCYAAIAVQASEHFLFLNIIQPFVEWLAISVFGSAVCAFLLLCIRLSHTE